MQSNQNSIVDEFLDSSGPVLVQREGVPITRYVQVLSNLKMIDLWSQMIYCHNLTMATNDLDDQRRSIQPKYN